MQKPKIVIFDIETMPDMRATGAMRQWTLLSNYPGQTFSADVSTVICIGWKILGEKKTHCINAWDFKNWKKDKNDDSKVLKEFLKVVEKADGVITQNGKNFDWPYVQTRLLINNLETMPDMKHADTAKMARNLKLTSKSLKNLGFLFGDGDGKMDSGGWDLWVKVFEDCKKAKKKMTVYCKQDVKILEKVFYKLQQFSKGRNVLPNMNQYRSVKQFEEDIDVCPYCGSEDIYKNGWHHTNTKSYQRVKCKKCGGNIRTNLQEKDLRAV